MKKYIITSVLALALLFTNSTVVLAQPGFEDDVTDTPIDGGIAILAAAGLAFGLKKKLKEEN